MNIFIRSLLLVWASIAGVWIVVYGDTPWWVNLGVSIGVGSALSLVLAEIKSSR